MSLGHLYLLMGALSKLCFYTHPETERGFSLKIPFHMNGCQVLEGDTPVCKTGKKLEDLHVKETEKVFTIESFLK